MANKWGKRRSGTVSWVISDDPALSCVFTSQERNLKKDWRHGIAGVSLHCHGRKSDMKERKKKQKTITLWRVGNTSVWRANGNRDWSEVTHKIIFCCRPRHRRSYIYIHTDIYMHIYSYSLVSTPPHAIGAVASLTPACTPSPHMIYIYTYVYSYIFIYIYNLAFRIDSFIVWHMSCDNNNTDFFGSHSKTNVTSPLWHMSCDNNRCNLFWVVSACQQKNLKSDAFILWYMSFDIRHKKVRDGHETVT